ncbi:hypothetical protein NEOLEDRAFT_1151430 [Neolentinus lepideus HHB14362 ss-1]|uniref:Uncharacterized protein n=1 Tax=Neolentinus lepideus HHB14362 ss-1 TaxID=1314782 RepID=A0A165NZS4_9AGAM|nr:hypothetical protein NEOLEDRAFT_1151430 [Neolentinus lepideus HHB14362 ss-1]
MASLRPSASLSQAGFGLGQAGLFCHSAMWFYAFNGIIILSWFVEAFLALRVWAVYGRSKQILGIVSICYIEMKHVTVLPQYPGVPWPGCLTLSEPSTYARLDFASWDGAAYLFVVFAGGAVALTFEYLYHDCELNVLGQLMMSAIYSISVCSTYFNLRVITQCIQDILLGFQTTLHVALTTR